MAAVCRFRRGLARRFFACGVWRSEVDGDFWTLLLFPFQGEGFPALRVWDFRLMFGAFFKGLPPSAVGWVRAAFNNLID